MTLYAFSPFSRYTALGVVYKGLPQKYMFSDSPPACPLLSACGLPLPPCGRPHLALDTSLWTGSVIAGATGEGTCVGCPPKSTPRAGAFKVGCSLLITSPQHAAQSKDKINREFMSTTSPWEPDLHRPISANPY